MTTTRPDRAFASHVRGDFYGQTHLEARIARAAAAYSVLVAWVEGMPQRNRDIDAEADALDEEVEQLRLDTKPIIDVIQMIDPRRRGNTLRMEALGAEVEALDLAADRKAAESLAERKAQAGVCPARSAVACGLWVDSDRLLVNNSAVG